MSSVNLLELKDLLVPDVVVEIVMAAMCNLPVSMPGAFRHSFTPIAAAGTNAQITQTAQLLASQMTAIGIGCGATSKEIQTSDSQVS